MNRRTLFGDLLRSGHVYSTRRQVVSERRFVEGFVGYCEALLAKDDTSPVPEFIEVEFIDMPDGRLRIVMEERPDGFTG